MTATFGPTDAWLLSEEQREFVRSLFGEGCLPVSTKVAWDGTNLIIEHVNLDEYLDLNPGLPNITLEISPKLISDSKMYFPVKDAE